MRLDFGTYPKGNRVPQHLKHCGDVIGVFWTLCVCVCVCVPRPLRRQTSILWSLGSNAFSELRSKVGCDICGYVWFFGGVCVGCGVCGRVFVYLCVVVCVCMVCVVCVYVYDVKYVCICGVWEVCVGGVVLGGSVGVYMYGVCDVWCV